MSPTEVTAFLAEQTRALVVALDAEGRPHGAVARLEVEPSAWAEGRATFAIAVEDPVVGLLAADPRACCVAERFPSYYEIAGVMLHGEARPAGSRGGETRFTLDAARIVSYDFSKLLGG
jgi:hypothetical protein